MQIEPEIEPPDPDEVLAEYEDELDSPEKILETAYNQHRYKTDHDDVWVSYYDNITDKAEIVDVTDTVYVKTTAHHLYHEITREEVSEAKPKFMAREISSTPVTKPQNFAEKQEHYYTDLTEKVCHSCDGDLHTCFVCEGSLQKTCRNCDSVGKVPHKVPCPECNGTNERSRNKCSKCNGSTTVTTTENCSRCDGDKEIEREIPCNRCGGDGMVGRGRDKEDCPDCTSTFSITGGSGTQTEIVTCPLCGGDGDQETQKACSKCDARGYIPQKCHNCDSNGRVEEKKVCPDCNGTQEVPCTTCDQTGKYCRTCQGSSYVCEFTLITSKSYVKKAPEHSTGTPPINTADSDWKTYYESEVQEIGNRTGVVAIKRTDTVLPIREVIYSVNGNEYTIYHYNGKYSTNDAPTTRVTLDDIGQNNDSKKLPRPNFPGSNLLKGLLGVPLSLVLLAFALDHSYLPFQVVAGTLWLGITYKITTKPTMAVPSYTFYTLAYLAHLGFGDTANVPTASRILAFLIITLPLAISIVLSRRE